MIELLVKDSRGNIIRHQLGEGKFHLGKSVHSDVLLMDKYASRHHADLIVTKEGIYLIDANSTNGIWVNGQRIKSKVLLQAGDSFQVASMTLTLTTASHYFALKKGRPYSQADINLHPLRAFKSSILTLARANSIPVNTKPDTESPVNKQA